MTLACGGGHAEVVKLLLAAGEQPTPDMLVKSVLRDHAAVGLLKPFFESEVQYCIQIRQGAHALSEHVPVSVA